MPGPVHVRHGQFRGVRRVVDAGVLKRPVPARGETRDWDSPTIVSDAVASTPPPAALIVATVGAAPKTRPVASMGASCGSLDVQVIGTLRMAPFLSRTVAVNRSVSPGLRKAAVGLIWSVFSVTTIVAVPRCAADGDNDVAHISTFPGERPVTSPVADTVATAGLLVSHVTGPGGATGVICNVLPTPTWLVDG